MYIFDKDLDRFMLHSFMFSTYYAGRQCPGLERKILYGTMVEICTLDFDATIVTCKKEEVVPLD
jgi:hypothetical protein